MNSLEILENIQKLLFYISEILSDESKLYLSKEAAIKEIRKYCDEYDVTYTELQQIKTELEAWEVVKAETLITDGGVIHMAIEGEDAGYETVIKAFEVEE